MASKKKAPKKSKKSPIKRVAQKSVPEAAPAPEMSADEEARVEREQKLKMREEARRIRMEKREKQRLEAEKANAEAGAAAMVPPATPSSPVAVPPSVADPPPVADLADARQRKKIAERVKKQEPFYLPMDELFRWKTEALDRRLTQAIEKIKAPLIKAAEDMVRSRLEQAKKVNKECVDAQAAFVAVTNEVVATVRPSLPEGYAVTLLEGEKGRIKVEYNPEQAKAQVPPPSQKV
jgi:hypothetical protein